MEGLIGFLFVALALAGSPGPNTLSLAATGAAFGAQRGLAYMIGLNLGMVVVMAITASGLAGLLLAIPGAKPAVVALAAAYFLYLAYRIATAPPLTRTAGEGREPSLAAGLLLSLVNPKGYAAMAAMFSSFVLVPTAIGLDIAAKMIVLLAIISAVNIAWLFAGAVLTKLFHDPATNRLINLIFAILLLASVAFALVV